MVLEPLESEAVATKNLGRIIGNNATCMDLLVSIMGTAFQMPVNFAILKNFKSNAWLILYEAHLPNLHKT